ncbi:MAG: prolyl oligopeptidase family serine peptidase [Acidobacteria bacterium]|nr:prolyl oligopeptidase family serine peptidase [Acidobacteriota bacterium]
MRLPRRLPVVAIALLLLLPAVSTATAQDSGGALTADDYAHAESFLRGTTNALVHRAGVRPTWLRDQRFWYRITTPAGSEFILVNPATGERRPAFDHLRIAAGLSTATGSRYTGNALPFSTLEFAYDGRTIFVEADDAGWACNLDSYRCAERLDDEASASRVEMPSPDGRQVAFVRDHNLWVRELSTGEERPTTRDGILDYGYATDNAGWKKSDRPIIKWSPDSKKIYTYQQDQRGVGEMYLADTRVGHPRLEAWKYPLPGDAIISMVERVVIDIDNGEVVRLLMQADQHRSTTCDDIACGRAWMDVQWNPDSSDVAFASTSRDHKDTWLRLADIRTGEVRTLLHERVETFFEAGNGGVNWRYLPGSDEFIWYSQRDDWGHLYLYDLSTGDLKHQITTGTGNVGNIVRVDEADRVIYFTGVGFEEGRDPYFQHLYRINFDGSGMTLLTPEDANHSVSLSPAGDYFVDSFSTPDTPPVAVLRNAEGELIAELETADVSALEATGWKPPTPFTVKGRDGTTDLYGLMFTPTNLEPNRKYPIINNIYPGPQAGSVGSRSFQAARGDAQAMAELGFVVIKLDGMGTPWRSKSFHETYYGDMGDNTLPDQIAGMRELAEQYPFIDLDRAGIWGHSGGGYATAGALFRHADFFKVGVSQAGNHDNRVYEDDWGEKWQGLLTRDPDRGTNYDSQANQTYANQLEGKLLLAHGTMDTNVPFYSTLLVVDALIAANKDFDLILFPNRGHGFSSEPYMMRRRWDYFVEHLMGAEPPHEYEIGDRR